MEKSTFTKEYDLLRNQLREIREQNGVTQVDLARRLKETQSYVSKVERGERRLDLVQLRAFCTALGIQLVEFVAAFEKKASRRK